MSKYAMEEISPNPDLPAETRENPALPWYNPRGWCRLTKSIVAGTIIVIIIAAVVGAVEGTKANRYPDYVPLKYQLQDTYAGNTFFDNFNYFSSKDPTKGFVHYVDRATAQDLNLTYTSDSSAVIRVDTSESNATTGRRSVRVESKNSYDHGLFIFDIIHTPYGCGTWPALWTTDGYNWPKNGEIDVLETTNWATEGNAVTLHTTEGCNMKVRRKQTGSSEFLSCDDTGYSERGCGTQGAPNTYGPDFNRLGGGVYAMEIQNSGIRVWFFPRGTIPDDITNSNTTPDPSTWGTALADFPNTNCDIPSHFTNQTIVANIDLCGELGAQTQLYTDLYNCPATCESFVAYNPGNFTEAYWEFASFRVYQAY